VKGKRISKENGEKEDVFHGKDGLWQKGHWGVTTKCLKNAASPKTVLPR
jgi:hypothetical protein